MAKFKQERQKKGGGVRLDKQYFHSCFEFHNLEIKLLTKKDLPKLNHGM